MHDSRVLHRRFEARLLQRSAVRRIGEDIRQTAERPEQPDQSRYYSSCRDVTIIVTLIETTEFFIVRNSENLHYYLLVGISESSNFTYMYRRTWP